MNGVVIGILVVVGAAVFISVVAFVIFVIIRKRRGDDKPFEGDEMPSGEFNRQLDELKYYAHKNMRQNLKVDDPTTMSENRPLRQSRSPAHLALPSARAQPDDDITFADVHQEQDIVDVHQEPQIDAIVDVHQEQGIVIADVHNEPDIIVDAHQEPEID